MLSLSAGGARHRSSFSVFTTKKKGSGPSGRQITATIAAHVGPRPFIYNEVVRWRSNTIIAFGVNVNRPWGCFGGNPDQHAGDGRDGLFNMRDEIWRDFISGMMGCKEEGRCA